MMMKIPVITVVETATVMKSFIGAVRLSPLNGRRYPGNYRRIGFWIFPRAGRQHGVPVDYVGHLLTERIRGQLRPLFGRPVPAARRVPRVVPGQRWRRRRRRRWWRLPAIRRRRPAAHPGCRRLRPADRQGRRRRLVSGRLGRGTVPAKRRLLRAGRLFATRRTAPGRPRNSGHRRCACNNTKRNTVVHDI